MARPEVQYCTTRDGFSIAYYVMGEGPPLVITSSVVWSHLRIRQIPEYHRDGSGIGRYNRIVRYDARGTGLSDRTTLDYSLDARVTDLEAVVDHLGLERFDLLGYGHGGPTAIAYTAVHPDRVAHLVLGRTWLNGAERQRQATSLESVQATMMDQDWEGFTVLIANFNTLFTDSALALKLARVYREAMTPKGNRAYWPAMEKIDVRPLLKQIRVPTLVVRSAGPPTRAGADLMDYTREIASKVPGARLVETGWDASSPWFGGAGVHAIEAFLGVGEEAALAQPPNLPSGMTAILFADIADSTALTERLGDAAFRAKARDLDAALRAIIRDDSGTPIEGKLLGDGVLAVFTSARRAIEAALACGRAGDDAGLPLHLGLHAGDVIREENNVYGGAVNIASRISGLSAPGEVLVSDIVRGLARTSAGVTFEARGDHALKGVADPQRIFVVRTE